MTVVDAPRAGVATAAGDGHPAGRCLGQRGQALAEMALIVLILFTLGLGVVEFGRAWMVLSTITNAARDGARAAALTPPTGRDTVTKLIDSATQNTVSSAVQTQIVAATGLSLTATVDPQADVSGVPMVAVTITGSVPYLFGLFGTGFALDRSVTFRDEGR